MVETTSWKELFIWSQEGDDQDCLIWVTVAAADNDDGDQEDDDGDVVVDG